GNNDEHDENVEAARLPRTVRYAGSVRLRHRALSRGPPYGPGRRGRPGRSAVSRLSEKEPQGVADACPAHRSRHFRAESADAGGLYEGATGDLPAPWKGSQVSGNRKAPIGLRRKGAVCRQTRGSRRP